MGIVATTPPQRKTSGGRARKYSDEQIQIVLNLLNASPDAWVEDDEPCNTRTCAHQRAKSVMDRLESDHKVLTVKATEQLTEGENAGKFIWKIGLRPADHKPRKAKSSTSKKSE